TSTSEAPAMTQAAIKKLVADSVTAALVRKPVKYAEMYRSESPKGNQRNWNNQKSQ
ncbi:hypothetical protein Tco_0346394, partial [Tanacetum coccineum]